MMAAPPVKSEIRQRDDGMFEVITGDAAAGPFPTYTFATVIAEGRAPESKQAPRFRRFKVIREVRIASA